MIDIYLFTFSKKENSTKRPSLTGMTPLKCAVKSPSSLINPVIELHSDTNPVAFNYGYIPDFNRYYFVSDWQYDRGLWIANLSVDVLATYKPYIGNTDMYIVRSSAGHNMYLSDRLYPITNDIETGTNSSSWNVTGNVSFPEDGYFYLSILSSTGTGSTCYKLSPANFIKFINQIFAKYDDADLWSTIELAQKNSIYNPIHFIYSCYWLPISLSGTDVNSGIRIGGLTVDINAVRVGEGVTTSSHDFLLGTHPQYANYGYYLNYAPYTRRVFSSKAFGRVEYHPPLIDNSTYQLRLYSRWDVRTGMVKIYTDDNRINIDVPIGIEIPITQNASNSYAKVMSIAKDTLDFSADLLSNNPLEVIGGGLAIAQDVASLNQMATSRVGSIGTMANYPFRIDFTETYYKVANKDSNNLGNPYGKVAKPSTLGGFMIAEKCVLDCPATKPELFDLRRYVESGFYYE